jgi:hypothetical protein
MCTSVARSRDRLGEKIVHQLDDRGLLRLLDLVAGDRSAAIVRARRPIESSSSVSPPTP